MKARVACAKVIAGVLRNEGSLNTLLPRFIEQITLADRPLYQELCFGTLRWYPAFQVIMDSLLDKPIKSKDAEITALIAMGLYQLRQMRTPTHAAVNESVACCQPLKRPWAKGLVNSVLRRYLREEGSLEPHWQQNPCFQTAHPLWLIEALKQAWPNQVEQIVRANNIKPPMTLRVNARKTSRQAYLDLLEKADIQCRPAGHSATGIYLASPQPVTGLPHFEAGWVSVQDEASQLCANLLSAESGQRVLDACCAPGGKTCHLLESTPELDELIALDIDGERLGKVADNLQRLSLHASLMTADAADLASWWDSKPFDRILLDAPCSATGVIRRHPDIKLLRTPADIDKLTVTQGKLLAHLWAVLKPGGRLLYTTCSVLPQENDGVVSEFVLQREDCQVIPINVAIGSKTHYGRQLLPEEDSHDGFYYCLLEKTLTATQKGTA